MKLEAPLVSVLLRCGDYLGRPVDGLEDAGGESRDPDPATRETLLEHVWGDSEYRDPRTVDVHIRHLREKLESDPKQPEFLFTVRGVGYRFKE